MTGEKTRNVVTHCLEAWAAWGKPEQLKTDNGPAYTAQSFATFCAQLHVSHVSGLPYNPQGQGIVERAHRTLKEILLKQKGGIGEGRTPRKQISLALFTLNFLILDDHGRSAAERHMSQTNVLNDYVKWKDILSGTWNGPDPVIARSRGALCVFPQNRTDPIWVPERLTRKVPRHDEDRPENTDADGIVESGDT